MLHHIQKSILDALAGEQTLRYSQLKPAALDGNVFTYHLKRLLMDDYIEQCDDGSYQLKARGRDYIVHRHEDTERSAHTIFLIVVRAGDYYLLRQRSVQPLLGYSGFVHGEPIVGEDVITSAQRRLYEKTALDLHLQIKGSALISHFINSELYSYSHAIILYAETERVAVSDGDTTGRHAWRRDITAPDVFTSCKDIVTMIEAGRTWTEQRYNLLPLTE